MKYNADDIIELEQRRLFPRDDDHNLLEDYRSYYLKHIDTIRQELIGLVNDDQYMKWLTKFLNRYPFLGPSNWWEIEEELTEEEVLNIQRLGLFIESVFSYGTNTNQQMKETKSEKTIGLQYEDQFYLLNCNVYSENGEPDYYIEELQDEKELEKYAPYMISYEAYAADFRDKLDINHSSEKQR